MQHLGRSLASDLVPSLKGSAGTHVWFVEETDNPREHIFLFSKIKDGLLVLLYKQSESSVINSAVFLLVGPGWVAEGL